MMLWVLSWWLVEFGSQWVGVLGQMVEEVDGSIGLGFWASCWLSFRLVVIEKATHNDDQQLTTLLSPFKSFFCWRIWVFLLFADFWLFNLLEDVVIVLLVVVGCGGGLVVGWWPCIKLSFFFFFLILF